MFLDAEAIGGAESKRVIEVSDADAFNRLDGKNNGFSIAARVCSTGNKYLEKLIGSDGWSEESGFIGNAYVSEINTDVI